MQEALAPGPTFPEHSSRAAVLLGDGPGSMVWLMQSAMAEGRAALGNIARMLGEMLARGQSDTPEFRVLVGQARQLSDSLRGSWKIAEPHAPPLVLDELDVIEDAEVPLVPIRATLGHIEQPGMVNQGPEVRTLQVLLRRLGFPSPQTGRYDIMTASAVSELQKHKGLPVTGVVGAETRQLLNTMVPAGGGQ